VSRDAHLAMKVSTKFEFESIIRYLVIALLMLIRYVTLWPWPLTLWPWSVAIHCGSRGQPLHQVRRSYGYPFLRYGFWHLPYDTIDNVLSVTAHAPYHVGGAIFSRIFEIRDPDLPTHYMTFMALRSHTRTVVRECCKGDDQSQWRRANFDHCHP